MRFLIGLVLGLGALAWTASEIVQQTMQDWVRNDLPRRAELAMHGARRSVVGLWTPEHADALRSLLTEITRDDRVMAIAACTETGAVLAKTADFPRDLSIATIVGHIRPDPDWKEWAGQMVLTGGPVHVTAMPIHADTKPLGFVVIVQDLSYAVRRDATANRFLLIAFLVLAAAAASLTIVSARLAWRGWRNELRRLLRGETPAPAFRPILQDVRELMDRMVGERESDLTAGPWSAERLRQTLGRILHGERVVIVANREPYIHERDADGKVSVVHPASGLVTAIEPVMRACSGVWVAHGSGSADREVVDARSRVRVPPDEQSYFIRRVWLTQQEEQGYYYGFSNEGLWPLCHLAHARPLFRSEDWRHYQAVNARFVEAACEEVDGDDPVVMVQDYHFALAPDLLRQRLPRATVLTFWHIPWPNAERIGICPWRETLLQGLLGSSILGFHTQLHCNNFLDSVHRYLEARVDREENAVVYRGRRTLVRPYPISLEWPSRWLQTAPSVGECRESVRRELNVAADCQLGIGVDRLDYTKGIEERLLAVERMLERFPARRGRFSFVQLAAPSRTAIERYRQLNELVEEQARRINARFADGSWRPILLLRRHHEPPTVFRFYRAADLCYVSSLHDGMNLVAKEFCAARDDERGVLVLSQFTGAARELTEALVVNPYDLDEASAAMDAALSMSEAEQQDRMRSMRSYLSEFNVFRWAGQMLIDAAQMRRQERLEGRLTVPAGRERRERR